MYKLLMILLFLIVGLVGCNNHLEEQIYVGKVDVLEDINDERVLTLYFYTTHPYQDIKCILEDEVINYTYEIDKNNLVTSASSDNKLYMHKLTINFEKQELALNEVIMEFDGTLRAFDIGNFILTDVFKDYQNNENIIIDVLKHNNDNDTLTLKVTNLTDYNIALISLDNLNPFSEYIVNVVEVNDLTVSSNEATITEEITFNDDNKNLFFVSTYLKYDYSYKRSSISRASQYFKVTLETVDEASFPDLEKLSASYPLNY